MQKTKILVLGGSGQVGSELCRKLAYLGQVIATDSAAIDLSKPDSIREAVRKIEPAILINAAAYTAVDKAESDAERAAAINAIAPLVLAEEAKRLGSLLVHYSTDYVFDGTKLEPYVETDIPNPLNVYGRTKLAGDQGIESVGGDYVILRTSWVYGARGSNFLLTILRLARERTELRIVDDQIGAPTSSECIAQATANLLAQVLSPGSGGLNGRSGIYNLTCSGETSWFGFAKSALARSAHSGGVTVPNLVPIGSSDYPQAAKRPANSRLSGQRLQETFGVRLPHWEQALNRVLETLAESAQR
jgi:dTDP-4-dehydrorhamnose reductase